ncbi:MAG: hypothetical protein ABIZ34_05060 [Candidatus Limnocylindrales bacterium]
MTTDLPDATVWEAPCRVCGQPMGGDADDQPDPPLGPMCGDCARAREFDQSLWELDQMDDD